MNAPSRSIRTLLSGVLAAGLFGSGFVSPVLGLNCQQHGLHAAVKRHCCCGENCKCGPSCSANSESSQSPQSTSVQPDLRDLGKISAASAAVLPAPHRTHPLADLVPSALASLACPQTLFAKHTCLRL
ncbi:MAG: hypothetical protein IT424_15510 [Pirellulales bacterium]|nr:hypothetical protein [Pirellulales bacterium]